MEKTSTTQSSAFIKIGRIDMTRAREAHIKAGDIKIDMKHIAHVAGKHKTELESLGLTALDFLRIIVENYNEIREAKDGAFYLGKNDEVDYTYTAIIGLNYNEEKKFWEIKTAIPMRTAVFTKKNLVWKKGANPLK